MVMVKKNIKFPLEMKNGGKVRTLEELKANFDIESILNYYFNGKLKAWLEQRFYRGELEQLEGISEMAEQDISQILCRVFEQDLSDMNKSDAEKFLIKRKKTETVRQFTEDPEILQNIEFVATSQDELENILSEGNTDVRVYLLGEQFIVNDKRENVEYIGINQPIVKLITQERFDAKKKRISFKNTVLSSNSEIKLIAEKEIYQDNSLASSIKEYYEFGGLRKIIDLMIIERENGIGVVGILSLTYLTKL